MIIRPRPIDLLLVNRSKGDGFIPTTMLEVVGENWDGTTMSGHIGGTCVENGIVYSDVTQVEINNKKAIRTNGATSYLTFTQLASGEIANYVVIGVYWMSFAPTNQSGSLIDFYDDTALTGNLRAMSWLSNDAVSADERYWAGYGYGTSGSIAVASDLQGTEDQTIAKIRVWLFESGQGKYYAGGGAPIITDSWIACQLGSGNQRKRVGAVSGGSLTAHIGHLSLHKFPSTGTISRVWLNNYIRELATFYNLSWTDIA